MSQNDIGTPSTTISMLTMAYTGERTYSTAHVTGATVWPAAKHTRLAPVTRPVASGASASAMVLIRI